MVIDLARFVFGSGEPARDLVAESDKLTANFSVIDFEPPSLHYTMLVHLPDRTLYKTSSPKVAGYARTLGLKVE